MDATTVAKIPFFYDVSGEGLDKLASILSTQEFKENQVIFEESDEQTGMYFILDGEVEVLKKKRTGEVEILAALIAPQVFGEMALVDRGRRSASVKAKTNVKVAELTRDNFERFLMEEPEIAVNIIRKIAHTISLRLRKVSASYANVIN